MFADALSYPFRHSAWIALLIGGVIISLSHWLGNGLLGILFFSYLFTYFLSVLGSTITGHDTLPFWPEYDNFLDSLILPAVRFYLVLALSALPLLILLYVTYDAKDTADSPVTLLGAALLLLILALLFFITYLPMAILAISACGTVKAALPQVVIPAIFRAGWRYVGLAVAWAVIYTAMIAVQVFATDLPYVGWLLAGVIGFFLLLFQARLLGLFYRQNVDAIGFE